MGETWIGLRQRSQISLLSHHSHTTGIQVSENWGCQVLYSSKNTINTNKNIEFTVITGPPTSHAFLAVLELGLNTAHKSHASASLVPVKVMGVATELLHSLRYSTMFLYCTGI